MWFFLRSSMDAGRPSFAFATLFVGILLAVLTPHASSETNITAGTSYTAPTEWTLAGSPYIVAGLLTIERTGSLTIRQGVQVRVLVCIP